MDNNGGWHYAANVLSRGTGLGTSGKAYKVSDHFKYVQQIDGQTFVDYVIRQSDDWTVNGPTSGDDYHRVNIYKVTVNAQGVPTTQIESSSTKCTG